MPAKNTRKIYVEGGYYHLYNRGVEKRDIFLDKRDYKVFLHFLKKYLQKPRKKHPLPKENLICLGNEINLLAFCLMPNHFHLLVKQLKKDAMTKLVRRVLTSYVMYFNNRYKREGGLFQGVYKAVLVDSEKQLLHLSRYIHLNPFELLTGKIKNLSSYPYSSYQDYLGKRKTGWLKKDEILPSFRSAQKKGLKDTLSYQSFVENYKDEFNLGNLTIEKL